MSAEFDRRKFVTPSVHRPWLAWGSAEMSLADKVEYDTRVRVTSPYDRLATAIIKLFVHYTAIVDSRLRSRAGAAPW